jgi:predicted porin
MFKLGELSMKKSLIALAALAATGVVSAQSSVTIAGIVDQAYYSVKQNSRDSVNSTKQTGFGEGSWAGSRIRFSGSEDLGGGLRANFWLEQGIAPSDGSGFNYRNGGNAPQFNAGAGMAQQNRQSYVGLSGGFGEIRLGRLYTAAYDMWTNTGHINGEFTGTTQAGFGLASRTKGLSYQSPKMGNFVFYGTIGGRDTETMNTESTENQVNGFRDRKEDLKTARVMWNSGPARAGLAYETMTQQCSATSATTVRGAVATIPANFYGATAASGCGTTNSLDSSMWALQGGYNLGVADIGFIVGNKEVDGTSASAAKSETSLTQLNVKVPVTGTAVELRYTYNLQDSKNAAGTKTSDIKGHFMNANYAFSKRTRGYISYGVAKDSVAAPAFSNEEKRFALGVAHVF